MVTESPLRHQTISVEDTHGQPSQGPWSHGTNPFFCAEWCPTFTVICRSHMTKETPFHDRYCLCCFGDNSLDGLFHLWHVESNICFPINRQKPQNMFPLSVDPGEHQHTELNGVSLWHWSTALLCILQWSVFLMQQQSQVRGLTVTWLILMQQRPVP